MCCSSSSNRRRPACIRLYDDGLSMESRYIRYCRLERRRRNLVGSRRICFYACCVDSTVSRDRLVEWIHGDVPACYAGSGDTAPLRRVVFLLQGMLLPATLLGLRSLDGGRGRLVADSILCTLLRHDSACTVLSFSRHSQHLLGDEDSVRCRWQTHALSKERDRHCLQGWAQGDALAMLSMERPGSDRRRQSLATGRVVSRVPLEY